MLPLYMKNCHKEINMNRLRKLVGILFVILGLTGLLGCNRGPQKDAIGSLPDLPEVSSGFTYQAAYTDIAAELLFADGESLLAEKNGQREIYEIVKEANLRGIAAAKPGARMCDVDKAARDYITEKGFGKYFTHRTGHSIGLEVHEAGDVSAVNEAVIRPGQCFSVEPGIYIPEEGIGVRIEDLALITEDGCEVLNHYPKDLTVVPFK